MIKLTLVVEEVNGAVLPHVDFSEAGKATQLEIEVLRELKIHELPGIVGFAAKSYLAQELRRDFEARNGHGAAPPASPMNRDRCPTVCGFRLYL
jgi:hypothetical protein